MVMDLRTSQIGRLKEQDFDVAIIGGGINGAVSAAALSAKGAKVALIEKGDFGGGTSSHSSNLVWGGIKYLESHEYFLVNKLCKSRNHLTETYPSTVKEIRFLTTIQKGFRFSPWFIYLGSVLYWFLGRFKTRGPKLLSADKIELREPIVNTETASGGIEYSDCYLYDNDARFVFNFIRSAMNYGTVAANYVESAGATRNGDQWHVQARDVIDNSRFTLRAKILINACGPEVDLHNQMTQTKTQHSHVFSKGVHLVVDRLTEKKHIMAFFASDGRLFFVIPMGTKTCIGTTDTKVEDPHPTVTEEDRDFILDNVNQLLDLTKPLTKADIISERCGVRPLAVDGKESGGDWVQLSRKHAIDVDRENAHISIFGGKLTDCLNVGDEIADYAQALGCQLSFSDQKWYGEPGDDVKAEFLHQAKLMDLDGLTDPRSSEPLTTRFWRRYGAYAMEMLEAIRERPDRARVLIKNAEYLRCEIEHAARKEMITKLDDFLRRRSKISMVLRREDIIDAPGIKEACAIFFGDQADAKLQEYIQQTRNDTVVRTDAA